MLSRYEKMVATQIKNFGSEEAWKKHMSEIGKAGGKKSTSRPFRDRSIARKAARASAIVRKPVDK